MATFAAFVGSFFLLLSGLPVYESPAYWRRFPSHLRWLVMNLMRLTPFNTPQQGTFGQGVYELVQPSVNANEMPVSSVAASALDCLNLSSVSCPTTARFGRIEQPIALQFTPFPESLASYDQSGVSPGKVTVFHFLSTQEGHLNASNPALLGQVRRLFGELSLVSAPEQGFQRFPERHALDGQHALFFSLNPVPSVLSSADPNRLKVYFDRREEDVPKLYGLPVGIKQTVLHSLDVPEGNPNTVMALVYGRHRDRPQTLTQQFESIIRWAGLETAIQELLEKFSLAPADENAPQEAVPAPATALPNANPHEDIRMLPYAGQNKPVVDGFVEHVNKEYLEELPFETLQTLDLSQAGQRYGNRQEIAADPRHVTLYALMPKNLQSSAGAAARVSVSVGEQSFVVDDRHPLVLPANTPHALQYCKADAYLMRIQAVEDENKTPIVEDEHEELRRKLAALLQAQGVTTLPELLEQEDQGKTLPVSPAVPAVAPQRRETPFTLPGRRH
ncbi:MAG: hypothetical protein SFZ03_07330 [Candidatus Melainabacteria bacterium]|nr:hypothetical protein [Candidatus Melainabacteria bacterium]